MADTADGTVLGTVAEFVEGLRAKGVRLRVEADDLRCQTPPGRLTGVELGRMRRQKADIIAHLRTHSQSASQPRLMPRSPGAQVPLTFQQKWLWGLMEVYPRGTFNILVFLALTGELDRDALRASLDAVIAKHEALRSRVVIDAGSPRQIVDPLNSPLCPALEAHLIPEAQEAVFIEQLLYTPLDPSIGPLFKPVLLIYNNQRHALVILLDHLISDGVSTATVLRDIRLNYVALEQGCAPQLSNVRVQYADYAVWQAQSDALWQATHGKYWGERLHGAVPISLPVDRRAPLGGASQFRQVAIRLSRELTLRLKTLCIQAKTSLPMGVLSVIVALMSRWCNLDDIVAPVNVVGRHLSDILNTVGYFAHILHLRIRLSPQTTFGEVLQSVRDEYTSALEHDDFGRVIKEMPQFVRSLWVQWDPAFDESAGEPWGEQLKGERFMIRMREDVAPQPTFSSALSIVLSEGTDVVEGSMHYRADLFEESALARLAANLVSICEEFVRNPHAVVSEMVLDR